MFKPFKLLLSADRCIYLDGYTSPTNNTIVLSVLSVLEQVVLFSRECARSYLHRHKKGMEEHIFYMVDKRVKTPCTSVQGLVKILDFLQNKGKIELDTHRQISGIINRFLDGETSLFQEVCVTAPDAPPPVSQEEAGARKDNKQGHRGYHYTNMEDSEDRKFGRIEKAITLVNQTYSNPSIPDDFKMDVVKAMRPYIVPFDKEAPASMDTDSDE